MDSRTPQLAHNAAERLSPSQSGALAPAHLFFEQRADGTIFRADGDVETALGRLPADLEGLKLTDLTAARSHRDVLSAMIAALRSGKGYADVVLRDQPALGTVSLEVRRVGNGGFSSRLVAEQAPNRSPDVMKEPPAEKPAKAAPLPGASDHLAHVSHEIRTPLNAVIGFADALRQESFGPLGDHRYRDYAKLIQESGQHVLTLVNDLLDLSKAEADKIEVSVAPTHVAELVEACASMLRLETDKAGLDLRVKTSPSIGVVSVDPKIVRQVIINLLSNALKFTDRGTITIRTRMMDGHLVIAVEDTGVGMSAEDLKRVGERFYQARPQGVRGARGTGLGLTLSQALAKAHGGRLDISSVPGKGTNAVLTIPLTDEKRKDRSTPVVPMLRQHTLAPSHLSADWVNDPPRRMA